MGPAGRIAVTSPWSALVLTFLLVGTGPIADCREMRETGKTSAAMTLCILPEATAGIRLKSALARAYGYASGIVHITGLQRCSKQANPC
jgi:hypothetical protein